jgi:hypothetical protein
MAHLEDLIIARPFATFRLLTLLRFLGSFGLLK